MLYVLGHTTQFCRYKPKQHTETYTLTAQGKWGEIKKTRSRNRFFLLHAKRQRGQLFCTFTVFPDSFILQQSMARLTADIYPSNQCKVQLKGKLHHFHTSKSVSSIEQYNCICVKSGKSLNKVFVEQTLSAESLQINIKVQWLCEVDDGRAGRGPVLLRPPEHASLKETHYTFPPVCYICYCAYKTEAPLSLLLSAFNSVTL